MIVVAHPPLTGSGPPLPLPRSAWGVSFDVHLAPFSRLSVGVGATTALMFSRGGASEPSLLLGGHSHQLRAWPGWLPGDWRHVEATRRGLTVDGQWFPVAWPSGGALTFRLLRGGGAVDSLIITSTADRGSLLLHRLAELHARLRPGQFPSGADLSDNVHIDSAGWTSGFWPGALWQAAALHPDGGVFARWALRATLTHFGQEHSDTHDVGFMYGQSSLLAWQSRCRGVARPPEPVCVQLRASVLAAADQLVALAASNAAAGTIPTNSLGPQSDTIVDSMMNIGILAWASRVTGKPAYASLASRHAHLVASWLVRPNGSTAQAVNFDRASGRELSIATHQGISATSTWARGEGWGLYGFAQTALDLHDRGLLRVALRIAGYVSRRLPAGGIPLWDYDAAPGAPVDASAGVITAAGMFHLAAACRRLPGMCRDPNRWVALGQRMLAASLTHAATRPPLGLLRSQVLVEHAIGCWCNGGELIFGLSYALEGLRLERRA